MATGSEELEGIGRALPREAISELYRLTRVVPTEAFSGMLGVLRAVPDDAIGRLAGADLAAAAVDARLPYLQLAVLQRAMRAVTVSFEGFDQEELARIAAEETDAEVLFELLAHSRLLEALEEKDPLAGARLRGVEAQTRLLAEAGGGVSAVEAGKLLGGISRQAVDARRKKGGLLAVRIPGGRRGWRYPRCQFDGASEDGIVPGLGRVLSALGDLGGWMALSFFLSPEERLGGSRPIDVLMEGRVEEVEEAALSFGEHGAD